MKVALDVLGRWIDLPARTEEVRRLMDECGLEVKRIEQHPTGSPIFVLELLANRGDHRCYEGVARELHGRLGGAFRERELPDLEIGETSALRVNTEQCLVYTATLLERRSGDERIDLEAARVLEAASIHSISGPVDATNITNLEIGQPTHAFDADKIEGVLTVRASRRGERAWPLFQTESVELPEGTMVIADDQKILAIAGVIGCEESKATASTRRLLLESAAFDPVSVRKASQALKIHTDSSARFERGSDPQAPLRAAARVVSLLESSGAWVRLGPTTVRGAWRAEGRVIAIDASEVSRFLAVPMSPADISMRLARYGFPSRQEQQHILVSVPSWRLWDVEFPADLYEELAKSIGYDTIPTVLPAMDIGALPSDAELRKSAVEDVLIGNGFYEVFTDGFYGRNALSQLGITEDHPLSRHVETSNALDRAYSLLKNNCLHQAVEAVAHGERHRTPNVKIYEWTRTFHPVDALLPERPATDRPPCTEQRRLWAIVSGSDRPRSWQNTGRAADVHFLAGLVEEISVELGLDLEVRPIQPKTSLQQMHPLTSFLHPGRRAEICAHGEVVGILGEVHPAVCKSYKIKSARPCYFEITFDALVAGGVRPPYIEPENNQSLVRSVSLGLPMQLDTSAVVAVMHANGPDWLSRIDVVDLFVPPGEGEPIRSVTFELHYSNLDAELTAEAANAATEVMIRAVLDQFGSRGVHQR